MGDVRERPSVDESGIVFERLNKIRSECLLQQHGHRAVGLDVAAVYWRAVAAIRHDDVPKPLVQIVEVICQAEDRHDLRGHGDVEAGFSGEPVRDSSERCRDLPERAVVHVHDPPPGDPADVDAEIVAPVDVIVDHGGQKIVRRGDRVEIAGEMKIHVLHWHDLRIAAARRSALHPEARTERRFSNADCRVFPDSIQSIA